MAHRGLEATCSTGRVIDFGMCARAARDLFLDLEGWPGPWRSHTGMKITINWRPAPLRGWRLVLAAPFPPRAKLAAKPDVLSKSHRRRQAKLEAVKAEARQEDANLFAAAGVMDDLPLPEPVVA